jgi:hypothetical protein
VANPRAAQVPVGAGASAAAASRGRTPVPSPQPACPRNGQSAEPGGLCATGGRLILNLDSRPGTPRRGRGKEGNMADFARIEGGGRQLWINLDHVTRIVPGVDPQEPATVRFTRGRALVLSAVEGRKLVTQLNRCCGKRKGQ